jgi:hypothetical protein
MLETMEAQTLLKISGNRQDHIKNEEIWRLCNIKEIGSWVL